MVQEEIFGFIAGAITTFSFTPQVWRLFRLRSAKEISLSFNLLLVTGVVCWLVYGILLDLMPVILWNCIMVILTMSMLFAKLRYGLRPRASD